MRGSVLFLLFIFYLAPAYAQPIAGNMDFSVSVGKTSGTEIFSGFVSGGVRSRYVLQSADRPIFISGKYYLLNRLAIGGTAGIQTLYGINGDYNTSIPFRYRQTMVTAAVEATFTAVVIKCLQIYGFCGIGFFGAHAVYTSSSSGKQIDGISDALPGGGFNSQITPLGVRVGGRVAAYAEFGIGYKGLMNLGLAVKIGENFNRRNLNKPHHPKLPHPMPGSY